jgi:hypothetical protein
MRINSNCAYMIGDGSHMKKIFILLWMVVLVTSLTACKLETDEKPVSKISTYVQELYESKNPYIGDSSATAKLINTLNVNEQLGAYTIELQTSHEPYVLKLNFKEPVENREVFDLSMHNNALILLALIENAGEVHWAYTALENTEPVEITVYVSSKDENNLLSKNIKDYGGSQELLQELVDLIEANM